jgi:hypothetical protein
VIEATIKIAGISTGETGDQPLEMNRPPRYGARPSAEMR